MINFSETPDFTYSTDNASDSFTHTDGHLSIEIDDFPSGFYEFKLSYQSNGVSYFLAVTEPIVEIADGLETEVITKAFAYTNRTYYATTSTSKGNGLTKGSEKKLSELLEFLSDHDSDWEIANIYIDNTSNLSDTAINAIPGKILNVYYNSLQIFKDSNYVTEFYISNTGNDSNAGSSDSPVLTLNHFADTIATAGYTYKDVTLYVDGLVTETAFTHFNNLESLTITGIVPVETPSADMTNGFDFESKPDMAGADFSYIPSVTIKDIIIKNANGVSDGKEGVIRIFTPIYLTIDSCTFSDNGKPDVYIYNKDFSDFDAVVTIKDSIFSIKEDNSPNIVYSAGNLNVEGTVETTIKVADGKTVNVSGELADSSSIFLLPDKYEQHEAIVSVADIPDLTIADLYDVVALFNEDYTITEEGYIEDKINMIKHITKNNYESFGSDNYEEGSILIIHSGVPANKLKNFFTGLGLETPVTLDFSVYDSDINSDSLAALFEKINVTCVILPDDMSAHRIDLFERANTLKEIRIAETNEKYATEDGVLYKKVNGVKTEIIKYPQAKDGEHFFLPDTVTSVAYGAFEHTVNLKIIENFDIITTISEMSVFFNSSVTNVRLNDNIKTIPMYFLQGSKIETITLPLMLTKINYKAFENCENLSSVTFLNTSAPTIDETAFSNCTNITQINVPMGAIGIYQNALPDELKIKVGDFILKDGTILSKNTTPEADTVAAVIVRAAKDGNPALGVGIVHNKTNGMAWCIEGAAGLNVNITELQGTSTSGYMDGSNGWEILKEACNDAEEHPENYPAWNYSLTYAETNNLTGALEYGWYLPTLAELYTIYENIETVDESLLKAGGDQFDGDFYLSCSQSIPNYYNVRAWNFFNGTEEDSVYKSDVDYLVCSVKAFH